MGERYEIRYGKWGAYFYDNRTKKDMPLEEVLSVMNAFQMDLEADRIAREALS